MAKNKVISAKMCEIVQQVQYLNEETIKNAIASQNCIDKWCYVLHDSDVKDDGTPKEPHWHIYLHFTDSRQFDYIAKWFKIEPQYVNKIKGKRFGDAIEYASHHNAPEKYQYPFSTVKANFDYEKAVLKNVADKENTESISKIITAIDNGEITPYNIVNSLCMADYVKYEKQIKKAFEFRRLRRLQEVNRNMNVIYMYGGSGLGKTTYAKYLAEKQGKSVFICSSENDPFDGYAGQSCVIMDDIRGTNFKFGDLLKLLDNNTASSIKARYRNVALECDLLIITTTKTPTEFYRGVFESHGEEFTQFLRRCGQMCYFYGEKISIYCYNPEISKHEIIATIDNPCLDIIRGSANSFRSRKSKAMELFGLSQPETENLKTEDLNLSEFIEILGDDE